mmetsp:Transcript_711/g.2459  ORF Transcript_711/g.2459 Transcript_711/m.2459 type:complete len:269 (-) Transcript_711:533-1339(-)
MLGSLPSRRLFSTLPRPFVYRCGVTGAVSSTVAAEAKRPLALCLGWSNASVKSLSKYAEVYAKRGDCDAILLPSTPNLVYSPAAGRASMATLARAVADVDRDLVVCGFSVGAYLYANFLMHLRESKQKAIERRIKGIVFDSPVDFQGVPRGLSRSVVGAEGSIAQRALEASIHAYLALFHTVARRYEETSDFLHAHDLDVPSLWIFSKDDFVVPSEDVHRVIHKWQQRGHRVTPVEFSGSKHVMHLPTHYDAYDDAIRQFFHDARPDE